MWSRRKSIYVSSRRNSTLIRETDRRDLAPDRTNHMTIFNLKENTAIYDFPSIVMGIFVFETTVFVTGQINYVLISFTAGWGRVL